MAIHFKVYSGELLDQASRLLGAVPITQADLRQSISCSYYALFHSVSGECSEALFPENPQGLRQRISRHFEHGKMKVLCSQTSRQSANNFGKNQVSTKSCGEILGFPSLENPDEPPCQALVVVAQNFVSLQQFRHKADYDLSCDFNIAQAQLAISKANTAILELGALKKQHPDQLVLFAAALLGFKEHLG